MAGMTVASVWPSYGLPGSAATWATNWPPRECRKPAVAKVDRIARTKKSKGANDNWNDDNNDNNNEVEYDWEHEYVEAQAEKKARQERRARKG
jgi:hypothetical protein